MDKNNASKMNKEDDLYELSRFENLPEILKTDYNHSALANKIGRCIMMATNEQHLISLIEQLYTVIKHQDIVLSSMVKEAEYNDPTPLLTVTGKIAGFTTKNKPNETTNSILPDN